MSTNYEYRYNECSSCARFDDLHIGKSSGGWSFIFAAHRDNGINSYKYWLQFFDEHPGTIVDEYGREMSLDDFKDMVEQKKGFKNHALTYPSRDDYVDPEGHSMTLGEFS